MDNKFRPFILPPKRLSTGRGAPVLLRVIASDLVRKPLNRRLHNYLERLQSFPDEPIVGSFKIEQSGADLHLQFSVNGDTEDFIFPDWRQVHKDDGILEIIRAVPWKLFQLVFEKLDLPFARLVGQETIVQVYPNHMRPTPKGRYDFTYFPAFYMLLLPVWQHGKEVYKSNRSYPNWRQTVRQEIDGKLDEYPARELIPEHGRLDGSLLDHLIARFERPKSHDDLAVMQAEVKDRRVPATAEELALDHSAGICGVPLYEYTARYLKELKAPKSGRPARRGNRDLSFATARIEVQEWLETPEIPDEEYEDEHEE